MMAGAKPKTKRPIRALALEACSLSLAGYRVDFSTQRFLGRKCGHGRRSSTNRNVWPSVDALPLVKPRDRVGLTDAAEAVPLAATSLYAANFPHNRLPPPFRGAAKDFLSI